MKTHCTKCKGALLPEWGRFHNCPTCREKDAAHGRSAKGRARQARFWASNAERLKPGKRATAAQDYADNVADKLCVQGCGTPVTKFRRCAACRAKFVKWGAEYRERKRLGLVKPRVRREAEQIRGNAPTTSTVVEAGAERPPNRYRRAA